MFTIREVLKMFVLHSHTHTHIRCDIKRFVCICAANPSISVVHSHTDPIVRVGHTHIHARRCRCTLFCSILRCVRARRVSVSVCLCQTHSLSMQSKRKDLTKYCALTFHMHDSVLSLFNLTFVCACVCRPKERNIENERTYERMDDDACDNHNNMQKFSFANRE